MRSLLLGLVTFNGYSIVEEPAALSRYLYRSGVSNWSRSLLFGVLTSALPDGGGYHVTIGREFGYNPIASILIGSLIASHTH